MEQTKIYEACYNDCIRESTAATISIHLSKQGARDALARHIKKERKSDYLVEDGCYVCGNFDWAWDKHWFVNETVLLP